MSSIAPTGRIVPKNYSDKTRFEMEEFLKEDKDSYHGPHVFGTVNAVVEGMKWIPKNFSKLETSYILFQGGIDKYVDLFAPIDMEKESLTKDKTTVFYRNMWH